MIDTLRFANRLKQAGFTEQQSEAFAEAWAEQARDDLPSRADMIALDGKVDRIRTELEGKIDRVKAELDGKLDKLTWMVGFTLAGVVAVIVRLLFVAEIRPADHGDTITLEGTLDAAAEGLEAAGAAPDAETPADLVADKGYHSREVLKDLDGGPWRSRIAEPKPKGVQRWQGDLEAQRAVYGNRARLRSGVAKEALKLRAERVERSFEHVLDRGGLRRTHLRGRANVQKRYLVHVAGFNLSLVMRALLGAGTPKELAARRGLVFWLIDPAAGFVLLVILPSHGPFEPSSERPGPMDRDADITTPEPQTLPSSTGC